VFGNISSLRGGKKLLNVRDISSKLQHGKPEGGTFKILLSDTEKVQASTEDRFGQLFYGGGKTKIMRRAARSAADSDTQEVHTY